VAGRPGARIWMGAPSWPIHSQIFSEAGLDIATFGYFDQQSQALQFEGLRRALQTAAAGDLFLLHGCCHNPTGADLDAGQWREVARLLAERGVVPLIDIA